MIIMKLLVKECCRDALASYATAVPARARLIGDLFPVVAWLLWLPHHTSGDL
jgi:hypothetical protein